MPCLWDTESTLSLEETPVSVFLLKESEEMALSVLKPPFLCPLDHCTLKSSISQFPLRGRRRVASVTALLAPYPWWAAPPFHCLPCDTGRRGWGRRRGLRIWKNNKRRAGELFSVLNTVLYWHLPVGCCCNTVSSASSLVTLPVTLTRMLCTDKEEDKAGMPADCCQS